MIEKLTLGGVYAVELRNCTLVQNDANLHPTVSGVGGSTFNGEVVELWHAIVVSGAPNNWSGTMTSNGNNLETSCAISQNPDRASMLEPCSQSALSDCPT